METAAAQSNAEVDGNPPKSAWGRNLPFKIQDQMAKYDGFERFSAERGSNRDTIPDRQTSPSRNHPPARIAV
jgi:hypothetical protein